MSELSPQAEANDMELATTKGRPHVAAQPSPHRGDGGPQGRMRGRRLGASPPWAPSSVSLAADSFPLEGGSHYGARSVRPYEADITTGRPHPPRCARHLPLKGKALGPPKAAAPTDHNGPGFS